MRIKYYVMIFILGIVSLFSSCVQEEITIPTVEKKVSVSDTLINKWEIPKQTRVIGGENFFENHVNIDDFKDFSYEDTPTWEQHQNYLNDLRTISTFPNEKNGIDRAHISRQLTLFAGGGQDIAEVFENGLTVNYE